MANAGSRSEVERAQRREKQRRKQELADLRAVMESAEGRRLIWRFLGMSRVFESAFNTNAMAQSHSIGWQDGGRWWLKEIDEACPEKYLVMANEARRAAKQAEIDDQSSTPEEEEENG